jgi:hypothetical protein
MACLAGLLGAPAVRAQTANAPAAETLFEQAKVHMASGDYTAACAEFAESYRIDPATGTLMGLALCHEAMGATASAWAEFTATAEAALRDHRADREHLARERAAALAPVLSKLTIRVSDAAARTPGLEVRRDGSPVGTALWGLAVPVDPGDHVIEASAPGRKTWSTRVTLGRRADQKLFEVPELGPADAPSAATGGESRTSPGLGQRRVGALALGAVGLAAIATGAAFGAHAVSEYGDATAHCSPSFCADPSEASLSHASIRDANVANVAVGVGLLAIAGGAYLWFTAPRARAASLGVSGTSVALRATW